MCVVIHMKGKEFWKVSHKQKCVNAVPMSQEQKHKTEYT